MVAIHSGSAVEGDPEGKVLFLRRTGSEGEMVVGRVHGAAVVVPSTIKLDETLIVLEGEARVELDDGDTLSIAAGDMLFLAKGTKLTWHFLTPFKEMFFATGVGTPPELGV